MAERGIFRKAALERLSTPEQLDQLIQVTDSSSWLGLLALPTFKAAQSRDQKARYSRVRTPAVLQMEEVECGAAALAMVLGYHGRVISLEQLRIDCGVSRDGTKATNILKAARRYGLNAKGFKKEIADLRTMQLPVIVFWNFNHFLVVEGFAREKVFLNDPAAGPIQVSDVEFGESYTGVVLAFDKGPGFKRGGKKTSLCSALARRLGSAKLAVFFVLLASLGLVIPGFVLPSFTRIFVDEVLIGHSKSWLKPLILGMLVAVLIQTALTRLQQACLVRLEIKLALESASKFFRRLLRLPMPFFAQRHPGEVAARVSASDRMAALLSKEIATTGVRVLSIIFFAAVMFSYDVLLTLAGIAMAVLNLVVLKLVATRRSDGNRRLIKDREKMMGTAMTGIQQIESIKASGWESDFFARWAGCHARVLNAEQRLGNFSMILMAAPLFLIGLTHVAVLIAGGIRVMEGRLTIGMLVAFQGLMHSFLEPVKDLAQSAGTIQEAGAEMVRLDDALNFDGAGETDEALIRAEPPPKLLGEVELRNITFGYNRCAPPLIENFNLKMRAGSRVALVGGSGSGKSTVSRILTGLYEPWSGEILFDGSERKTLPPSVIANSLALVDQDLVLFAGTIRDNLTLWDSTFPDSSVMRAAKDAAIHDVIASRHKGYEGEIKEDGGNFSGGQRQRLDIARALVGNPSILVMDEGTSALDPATENLIDKNIRQRGCTCLIIAHRLSTIRDADEIIVLERGVVVQRGSHDEMIAIDGPYARLIMDGCGGQEAETAEA